MTPTATPKEAPMDNPLCPDHSAHSENAFDRLYPAGDVRYARLNAEQMAAVDAEAEAEYQACEGH